MLVILILPFSLYPLFKKVSSYKSYSAAEYISIKLPFSIYTAWVTIASLANFMVTLVYFRQNWPNNFLIIAAAISLLIGLFITIKILQRFKNIPFAAVVIWAYFGIIAAQLSLNQPAYTVVITAAAAVVIIILQITAVYSASN